MINDTTIEKLCNSISGSQLFVARLPDSTYTRVSQKFGIKVY